MANTPETVYKQLIQDLKTEKNLDKLCAQLYNLTQLYWDFNNWNQLEKFEDEYVTALENCDAFNQPFEKRPTLNKGDFADFSSLVKIKGTELKSRPKSIIVLLRHLA